MAVDDFTVDPDFVDKLFIHVYCDLGQRFEEVKRSAEFKLYHQINIGRLCRQLLVDGSNGLYNQANRRHRLKIRFLIPKVGPAPIDLPAIPDELELYKPDLAHLPPGYYIHPLTVDGYLADAPMVLGDRWIKNLDVIRYVANSFGGVHLAPILADEHEQTIARFQNHLMIGDSDVVLQRMMTISQDVLRFLDPLRKQIEKQFNEKVKIP